MSVDDRFQQLFKEMSQLRAVARVDDPLYGGGGNSTSGGMSDDWKANVERQLERLHGDVRHLLFGLIGGFLVLGGAGWTAYAQLSDRIATIQVQQAEIKGEAKLINQKLDTLLNRYKSAR